MKHWVTLKQTVTTSKFSVIAFRKVYELRIKQMNQQIKNGNGRIHSFPGAISHKLLYYLDVNLDKYTEAVVIPIGINDN